MWVEPDMNITGGESLVRQCLYGKRFWQEEFDLEIRNLWLPDVFGYSAALPQILKKSGVDFFMTQKISWNETNIFPHHTFYWEGIDGSRIATHFLPTNDYNCANLPRQLKDSEERFAQSDVADEFLNLFGIGDGGGGPGRSHIELGLRQQNTEGAVKFKFAPARDYFKKLAALPAEILPVWKGELYLELHRGTYTTQALMKKYNRQLEQTLHDTEFFCVLAENYDKPLLDSIWKNTLLNQFHDILPGSSIKEVYEDAHSVSQHNLMLLEEYRQQLLEEIHPAGNTGKAWHYLVYNTLSWERQEMISFELPDEEEDWQAMDCRGEILPAAVQGDLMLAKVIVPELGYTCVKLQKTGMKIKNTRQMTVTEKRLENELIRVDFNENGNIISIIDKELQREMLAGMANLLLLFDDKPNDWDAWDINHYYRQTEPEVAQLKEIRLHKTDYLWGGLWLDYTIGNSTISQLISLKCESRMIECWTYVNWQEKNKMLKVRAVPDIISQQAAFEIQFGYISRPTHSNTSWEAAKFEVSGHRYADLSQKECGFAIVNDCKYGHYIKDNVMELTLLRSPQNPDPSADAGEHTFRYGWLPHCGELVHSEVFKKAHEFNSDLILQKTFKLPKELNKSFFKLEGKNVKIETIKPAENGEGVILRLYEYYGSESEICLKASRKWKQLSETNLMEKDEHLDCKATDHTKFDFKPFEIRTFRIIF